MKKVRTQQSSKEFGPETASDETGKQKPAFREPELVVRGHLPVMAEPIFSPKGSYGKC